MNSAIVVTNAKKLAASGNHQEAERMLRGMLTREPRLAEGWLALGRLMLDQRRHEHAAEALTQSLRLRPDQAEAYLELARALGGLKQWQAAMEAARTATRLAPKNADAWLELAKRSRLLLRIDESLAQVQRANSLRPNHPDTLGELCIRLQEAGRVNDAAEVGRRAVELSREPKILISLAASLLSTGNPQEALALFEEAQRLAPNLPDATMGIAHAAEVLGDKNRAIEIAERAIEQGSLNDTLVGLFGRLAASDSKRRPRAIELVRAQIHRRPANPVNAVTLGFALGALLEAEQDFAGAFEAYSRANSLIPNQYSPDKNRQLTDALIEIFSAQAMSGFPRSDRGEKRPVLVVGMPRSGTTLLEQIIASHPHAAGAGELESIRELISTIPQRLGVDGGFPSVFNKITREVLNQLADEYLAELARLAPGKHRVVDKMPHNFMALGVIALMLPGATLVHSRRNPLDTCISCFTTSLRTSHSYRHSLSSLAHAYGQYHRLMQHWDSVLGERLVQMDYEKLIADPEPESRRLIAAVGLDWDPACLKFYEGNRAVTTASVNQVRRPMYSSSIGRWKHYEPYIGELIDGLKDYL